MRATAFLWILLIHSAVSWAQPWPTGQMGDLLVKNGETVTITVDHPLDYRRIDVQRGGTLLLDSSSSFAAIGATESVVLDGKIVARGGALQPGSYTLDMPDGAKLTLFVAPGAGGAGGSSDCPPPKANGGRGGAQGNGNGGGGGAWFKKDGGAGSMSSGGKGAKGVCGRLKMCGDGGAGGTPPGAAGENGGEARCKGCSNHGGGGGGGSRGPHGKLVYVKVLGSFDGTGGDIDVRGGSGGNGGAGGNAVGNNLNKGGGGGGGGGGGSGGVVVIRYGTNYQPARYRVQGGAGGRGGAGGTAGGTTTCSMKSPGVAGTDGKPGPSGRIDIKKL